MTLYILDTDHVSLAQRGHPRVAARIAATPPEQLAVSIVTVQEQLQGRLAQAHHASDMAALVWAYRQLHKTRAFYFAIAVADFDERAAVIADDLRRRRISIGAQDLRIAAVALAASATFVTRNRRDFERVPGLAVEDWSA